MRLCGACGRGDVSDEELKEYAINNIGEPGAKPKLEILEDFPTVKEGILA